VERPGLVRLVRRVPGRRRWEDAVKYGFVSAGGGEWYSRSIRKLSAGARIFTRVPKAGYVGVGIVTGEPMPFAEVTVNTDGQQHRLADLPLNGNYVYASGDEWVVPVRWLNHRPREKAFWPRRRAGRSGSSPDTAPGSGPRSTAVVSRACAR